MSALDLITMTHSQDCNAYFILGERCRCGATQAATELAVMRARLAALEAVAEAALNAVLRWTDDDVVLLDSAMITLGNALATLRKAQE